MTRPLNALLFLTVACSGHADPPGDATAPLECGPAVSTGDTDMTLTVPGWDDRAYDLLLPAGYACDRPLPVLLSLHGGASNKEGHRRMTCPEGDVTRPECLHAQATAAGFAVVIANGTPGALAPNARTWNAGGGEDGYVCSNGRACRDGIDDVAYFEALLDELEKQFPVDGGRVFVAGFSNGAGMSHRLACELSDRIVGIAAVSGTNQFETAESCTPGSAVAVIQIHGTADPCWGYEDGPGGCLETGLYVGVPTTMANWAQRNGCDAVPSEVALPDTVDDGTTVVRHEYSGCDGGGPLVVYEVVGGGHRWPGGFAYPGAGNLQPGILSQDIAASSLIVELFSQLGR